MTIPFSPRLIHIAFHVLIWSTQLLLPYVVSTAANGYKIGDIPGAFFPAAGLIHMAIFYINAFYLYPKWLNRRFWWLYLLASIALVGSSLELKYHILAFWLPDVLKNPISYKFVFGPSIAFFFISIVYRKIIDQIRLEKQQAQKQAEQLSAELKFLRSQISPHFLFNVLTNLVSLARKKSDQVEPSLLMLSDLMRYMLYDTQGKKIALQTEIDYLTSYVDLQKLRFGQETPIYYQLAVDDVSHACLIEPMLLIPFVENAFKHGLGSTENPQIRIHLSANQEQLIFDVQNKFDPESAVSKDTNSGIGLRNLKARLELLYRGKYTLSITDTDNWFHSTLTVQLI
ncbi:sensor histidine kinase [Spirosoma jeollabukense]